MRKISILIAVLSLVVVSVFGGLAGCNQDVNLPGIAWAEEEILEYDVIVDSQFAGSMVVTTKRLDVGEHALPKFPEEKYTVTSTSSRGSLVTKKVFDGDGKEIMFSESLMNGFVSLASYKEVKTDTSNYTLKVRYDNKKVFYSYNGAEEKKLQVNGGFTDNEIMYNLIRCYQIESNYSTSLNLVNPASGKKETLSVSALGEGTLGGFEYVNGLGESNIAATSTRTIVLAFSRTQNPKGKGIEVHYTIENETGTDGFYLNGNPAKGAHNRSTHIPVKIVENDTTFLLKKVTAA